MNSFICDHCHENVPISMEMAVRNRNHCPHCLWSKHVDDTVPGDRASVCDGMMKPVGLTLKKTKPDKYGKTREAGELMLVHRCTGCEKLGINRIAADDDTDMILETFARSQQMENDQKEALERGHIHLLSKEYQKEVITQLFGNPSARRVD